MLSSCSRKFTNAPQFQNSIEFVLNGKKMVLEEGSFDPTMTVAQWLRLDSTNLKGTKIACGEGGCGACTILVSNMDPITHQIKHRSVDSCLMLMGQVHHQTLTTIEGLGTIDSGITPVQKALIEHHGTQCGYCTPGFVMNASSLLLENPHPTTQQIDEHFDGNLCRCTGYRGIQEALREFSSDASAGDRGVTAQYNRKTADLVAPTVPKEFYPNKTDLPVALNYKGVNFFVPTTVEQLVMLKKEYPNSKIVVGGSEVAVDLRFKGKEVPTYISTHRVEDLYHLEIKDHKLVFGANTSLLDIQMFCRAMIPQLPACEQRLLRELEERLRYFGSTQIRNTATVVGNIMHAGAVTDMTNFMLATDPTLTVINSATGEQRTETMDNFFVGYRKTKMNPTDIVTEIEIPLLKENEHVFQYKQAHRREDDICICSATFKVRIGANDTVEDFKAAFSGMSAFPQRARKTEQAMIGKKFTLDTIHDAMAKIAEDLPIVENAPGGHEEFRRELAPSFLFQFFHETQKERGLPHDESACGLIERPAAEFSVGHAHMKVDENTKKVVQLKLPDYVHGNAHMRSAAQQTTGEAVYIADMPTPTNGLCGAFVGSAIPHGKIVSADYSKCLAYPGVIDVVTAADIKGINKVGDVIKDEEVFAEKEVVFRGQPIAMVVAVDQDTANAAAKLAEIKYEALPEIVSIPQAIEAKSYYPFDHYLEDGDIEQGFKDAECVIEGETMIGAQAHFYLETHNAIAIPGEDGRMTLWASTQNPTFAQLEAARVLGVPANKVDVHVKRLGGAFGSKETRDNMLSNALAVAAQKLKRPVRLTLDRAEDFSIMGTRHPFLGKYKCGFNKDGRIISLNVDLYADCGWSLDCSLAITDRALFHVDSSYKIPNLRTKSYLCKTNNISNTAFRGFGAPQGVLVTETVIEHIAEVLHKKPEEIRYMNMYREGDKTHFGAVLTNCNNVATWNYIKDKIDIKKERVAIDEFNRTHRYKKRGIALTPVKYGIAFTWGTLNQGGALVHIYKDGTVLVSHGGVEMGQGLHTKMCQVAATALRVPLNTVHIDETSTDKVANTSATSASSGADLNGHAILNACNQINARLDKYRTPDRTFQDAVMAAYRDKVNLTANGHYGMPEVGFDWVMRKGIPFQYYTYGAALAEVEIDLLTGDHQVLRADMVYDAGDSLNPAIDIGQIEGAFLQGYGYLTMEEFIIGDEKNKWVPPGKVQTNGPGYYKVPGYNDVPIKFNVDLFPHSQNPLGVYSSKAIAEPPLLLANSVPLAIADAMKAAREENHVEGHFQIDYPLTADRIRVLSGTKI